MFGGTAANRRFVAWALAKTAIRGCLSSCAIEADNSATVATREARLSFARVRRSRSFGPLTLVDVHRKTVPLDDLSFGIPQGFSPSVVPTILSVGTTEPMDDAERLASLHGPKQRFRYFLEVVGVKKFFQPRS
jgi:hypothetical protein